MGKERLLLGNERLLLGHERLLLGNERLLWGIIGVFVFCNFLFCCWGVLGLRGSGGPIGVFKKSKPLFTADSTQSGTSTAEPNSASNSKHDLNSESAVNIGARREIKGAQTIEVHIVN